MGRPSRSCHGEGNRLHPRAGGMQDTHGVWRRARRHSLIRNRRDPSWRPTSGEGGSYKSMTKGSRAGRESEGFVVLLTLADKAGRGKGPCFGRAGVRGKRKGMVARPNHPLETRENSHAGSTSRPSVNRRADSKLQSRWSDVPPEAWVDCALAACTPHEKTIGKPDAGNSHVRFERGPQETEPVRHRA